jgi:hypothetical protein
MTSDVGGVAGEGEVRQVNRFSARLFGPPTASGASAPAKALGCVCACACALCLQRAVKVTRDDTVYRMRHAQDTTLRNPERRDDAGEELLSTCKRFGRCPCVLSAEYVFLCVKCRLI